MQRFGKLSPQELNGDQVHCLENVITLWDAVSSHFYRLQVWFEPSVGLFETFCLPPLT
jgi:hypothetical protein